MATMTEKAEERVVVENREGADAGKMPAHGEKDENIAIEATPSDLTRVATFPKELERKVRNKLDWNIIPLIATVYMLSVLDRSNVGNARVAGMSTDLDLTGNRYTWLLTIFYIPCISPSSTTVMLLVF